MEAPGQQSESVEITHVQASIRQNYSLIYVMLILTVEIYTVQESFNIFIMWVSNFWI